MNQRTFFICLEIEVRTQMRILDGLVLCQKQGLERVVIHTDSLEARSSQVLHGFGKWRVRHGPKQNNKVADFLAKISTSRKEGIQVFDEVPPEMIDVLN
ncbi:hypothetical protein Gohar_009011, partial [Gossypium harknessii]|nr:hypothetical protein [Gossypium harknessii]